MGSAYLWVKSFHIVFVASWFAGLFYLPRLFVNLAMVAADSHAERARLLLMARKLYRFAGILMLAAVVLGLSRAFGETMAVLMVAGNVARLPVTVLDPAYPLPALIANNYGEMMSIPLYDSALMLAALVLLAVVLVASILGRWILVKVERRAE